MFYFNILFYFILFIFLFFISNFNICIIYMIILKELIYYGYLKKGRKIVLLF